MRIRRLQIEGFRSLKAIDFDVPQICALVGPNNSGKSNLLDALRRVLGRDWVTVSSFSEDDVWKRDPDGDAVIKISLDPPLQYVKLKGSDPVEIHGLSHQFTRYKRGEKKGLRRLETGCLDNKGDPPVVLAKQPKKGEQRKYEPLIGIPQEVRDQIPLIYIGTRRSLRDQLPDGRYSMLRQMLEDVDEDLHNPAHVVTVERPSGTSEEVQRAARFGELIGQAMTLLRTDAFVRLEESIKRNALRQLGFDPGKDTEKLDFYFSPLDTLAFYKLLDLRVREGDFSISATELGEGIQNVLVLGILQAFEEHRKKGAILLIEEPEMFLHPQKQRSLYRTLREIGETNQVIYTTHSPHFVCIPEFQEVALFRNSPEGTVVRQSSLPIDPKRTEKLQKEFDPERNELFFATKVLLVEGDTEKLAIPEFARRCGVDLDREGVTIVEVGGKRNIPEFAAISGSFGIPTAILFDQDSSDFNDKGAEAAFNEELKSLAHPDGSMKVWMLSKDYEDVMRKAVGEEVYLGLCQKYPQRSKAVKARLLASDPTMPIVEPVAEILKWLKETPDKHAAAS
jgi:predicted ATP-dependent endonuclease of OLD family